MSFSALEGRCRRAWTLLAGFACLLSTAALAGTASPEREELLRKEALRERFDFEGPTDLQPGAPALPVGWQQYTDTSYSRHGRFPSYFVAEHVVDPGLARRVPERPGAQQRKCVRIRMSGGRVVGGVLRAGEAAIHRAVAKPIDSAYAYEVSGYARAIIDGTYREGPKAAKRTRARLRLEWLDAEDFPVRAPGGIALSEYGDWVAFGPGDSGWGEVPELRVNDVPAGAAKVRLWVMVESTDRDAAVCFDDLAVLRRPRVILRTYVPTERGDKETSLYRLGETLKLDLTFKGLSGARGSKGYRRVVKISDMNGNVVLLSRKPVPDGAVQKHLFKEPLTLRLKTFGPFELEAGLYSVGTDGKENLVALRTERIGHILPYLASRAAGEIYGVDLVPSSEHFDRRVSKAFGLLGVLLVRIPLWERSFAAEAEPEGWRALDRFLGLFGQRGGRLVGVLGEFPEAIAEGLAQRVGGMAPAMKANPQAFESYLAATVGRFQFYVDSWQLGPDGDGSFAQAESVDSVVRPIRRFLQSRAELKRISVPWPSAKVAAAGRSEAVDAYTIRVPAEARPEDISKLLAARANSGGDLWLVIEPKRLDDTSAESRRQSEIDQAVDLTKKLVLAKAGKADRVFVGGFADPSRGLVSARGPNASYYALATCATMLTRAEYKGPVPLAAGVPGHLFARPGGTGLLVAWRDDESSTIRPIYLGRDRDVSAMDLFGNERTVPRKTHLGLEMQKPRVGAEPVFLTGLDLPLMLTRRSVSFESGAKVYSRFRSQRVGLCVRNHFGEASEVRIAPAFPRGWKSDPAFARVSLAAGDSAIKPLWVRPAFSEKLGSKEVLIELRFHNRNPIRLTRTIDLVSDIELFPEISRRHDGRLELEVEVLWRPEGRPSRSSLDLAVYSDLPGRSRRRGFLFGLTAHNRKGLSVPIVLDPVPDDTPIRVGAAERGGGRFINIESTVGKLLSRRGRDHAAGAVR